MIQNELKKLGVKEINDGTSTGSNWFSNGEIIESYSPVDGKLIGKVKTTTQEDYEKVITTAQEFGEKRLPLYVEKSSVSLDLN